MKTEVLIEKLVLLTGIFIILSGIVASITLLIAIVLFGYGIISLTLFNILSGGCIVLILFYMSGIIVVTAMMVLAYVVRAIF